jgi:hypothetical protein
MRGHSTIVPPRAGTLHMVGPGGIKMDEIKSSAEEPKRREDRMLPGGSLEDARREIGMNAIDRDMLPSYGRSTEQVISKGPADEPTR